MDKILSSLASLPFSVLDAILKSNNCGGGALSDKKSAILAVQNLILQGRLTLDEALKTKPSRTADAVLHDHLVHEATEKNSREALRLATDASKASYEAHLVSQRVAYDCEKAGAKVLDVSTQLDSLKKVVEDNKFGFVKVYADLSDQTRDISKQVDAIKTAQRLNGVDPAVIEAQVKSETAKLFASFKTKAKAKVLTSVADRLHVTELKKARDLFDVTHYNVEGDTIDFGDYPVEFWGHADAPARVDDYVFNPENLHQALIALKNPLPRNSWLAGERGTGKTEFVTQLASRLGRKLYRINFDEALERADFIGGNSIEAGSVVWKEGIITQAIQDAGALILLDEIGFARPQNLAVLHALCEHSIHRAIVIAETGKRIPVASHVAFFCADNSNGHGDASGNFAGVRDQNTAFLDRFGYTLRFEYLPFIDEVALVEKRTGLAKKACEVLVQFANVAREKAQAGLLTQPPSLRQILAWAEAVQEGLPVGVAFKNAIINKFPADCEAELKGIFSATINVGDLKSYLGRV